jgi:hypothetical protein
MQSRLSGTAGSGQCSCVKYPTPCTWLPCSPRELAASRAFFMPAMRGLPITPPLEPFSGGEARPLLAGDTPAPRRSEFAITCVSVCA